MPPVDDVLFHASRSGAAEVPGHFRRGFFHVHAFHAVPAVLKEPYLGLFPYDLILFYSFHRAEVLVLADDLHPAPVLRPGEPCPPPERGELPVLRLDRQHVRPVPDFYGHQVVAVDAGRFQVRPRRVQYEGPVLRDPVDHGFRRLVRASLHVPFSRRGRMERRRRDDGAGQRGRCGSCRRPVLKKSHWFTPPFPGVRLRQWRLCPLSCGTCPALPGMLYSRLPPHCISCLPPPL